MTISDSSEDNVLSIEDAKDEYLDTSNNQRHWGSMRFHALTVFFAAMGGLLLVFQTNSALSIPMSITLRSVGFLIVALFWLMDERIFKYWKACFDRCIELEKHLNFRQYTNAPSRGLVNSRLATRLLFILFLIFWFINLLV